MPTVAPNTPSTAAPSANQTEASNSTRVTPCVTAIVPARNEEAVIAPCVESLARQPEIAEIIVVNDQSTDRTAEIVRGLMAKIPRLRLIDSDGVPAGWM